VALNQTVWAEHRSAREPEEANYRVLGVISVRVDIAVAAGEAWQLKAAWRH
jgi:hypothetical protein